MKITEDIIEAMGFVKVEGSHNPTYYMMDLSKKAHHLYHNIWKGRK